MTRRLSDDFIGTMTGLLVGVLLLPAPMTKEILFIWLMAFPGVGALIGTVIGILRNRGK